MQHYWAAALFKPCWLLVVAAALIHRCDIIGLHAALFKSCWLLCSYKPVLHPRSYIGAALLGCSTLQAVLAARIQQHPYIDASSKAPCYISHFVLAERLYNCAARSRWQQHSYIDAAFLGCSTLQAVLAARSWQRHPYVYAGSEARLVHLSIPACLLLVLAAAPYIQAALLGCSTFWVVLAARFWQRHPYVYAGSKARLVH